MCLILGLIGCENIQPVNFPYSEVVAYEPTESECETECETESVILTKRRRRRKQSLFY